VSGKYNKKDHFHRQAKSEGYRSRASFKLMELDKRYRLFRSGGRVLDLGCAPGGWLQVAASSVGASGVVVGVDIEEVPPFTPVEMGPKACLPAILHGDIRDEVIHGRLRELADGAFDVVLSDMSPKLSGVKDRDIAQSIELVEMAFGVAEQLLRGGGTFVAKVFSSGDTDILFEALQPSFKKLFRAHPKSSRKTSTELYLIGIGFQRNK
jgi:23S rRNA (uridine2552-2'-O)-methyltransferase